MDLVSVFESCCGHLTPHSSVETSLDKRGGTTTFSWELSISEIKVFQKTQLQRQQVKRCVATHNIKTYEHFLEELAIKSHFIRICKNVVEKPINLIERLCSRLTSFTFFVDSIILMGGEKKFQKLLSFSIGKLKASNYLFVYKSSTTTIENRLVPYLVESLGTNSYSKVEGYDAVTKEVFVMSKTSPSYVKTDIKNDTDPVFAVFVEYDADDEYVYTDPHIARTNTMRNSLYNTKEGRSLPILRERYPLSAFGELLSVNSMRFQWMDLPSVICVDRFSVTSTPFDIDKLLVTSTYVETHIIMVVLYITINIFKLYFGDGWQGLFKVITGYGLRGSSMVLLGRVAGDVYCDVYNKAADFGPDFIGKVERNILEDDPRIPVVIADNVGANVDAIAGMGSDLFGSFAESSGAALVVNSAGFVFYSGGSESFLLISCSPLILFVAILRTI